MSHTTSFFADKPSAMAFIQAWKSRKNHSAIEHLLRVVALGKDPVKAFSPLHNKVKIANAPDKWHFCRLLEQNLLSSSIAKDLQVPGLDIVALKTHLKQNHIQWEAA